MHLGPGALLEAFLTHYNGGSFNTIYQPEVNRRPGETIASCSTGTTVSGEVSVHFYILLLQKELKNNKKIKQNWTTPLPFMTYISITEVLREY